MPKARLLAVLPFEQRLHDAVDEERDQDRREGELHIRDAHDDRIDAPARIARDEAERDADRAAEQDAEDADQQRDAQAVEDRRPQIAALIVGAEQEARHRLRPRSAAG